MKLSIVLILLFIPGLCHAGSSGFSQATDKSYACEIQSYLIRVVLGLDGDPSKRPLWSEKGLHKPLDFNEISDAMRGVSGSELDYILLDYNLFELLNLLYHYDPELNLHGSSRATLSPYPSPEFVALRLLLLKRLHRKEPLSLARLLYSLSRGAPESQNGSSASGPTPEELNLVKQIVASRPSILDYMLCPFLVKALLDAGILDREELTLKLAAEAVYEPLPLRLLKEGRGVDNKVVILPSFTRGFIVEQGKDPSKAFSASQELQDISKRLVGMISAVSNEQEPATGQRPDTNNKLERYWFYLWDKRPLAVFPGNAREVITRICPEARLTIVLLDRNIRLSMQGTEKPGDNWIFVDSLDVQYGQLDREIALIRAALISSPDAAVQRPQEALSPR